MVLIPAVDIPEERGDGFIIDEGLVVLCVLPEGELPELEPDLVPALAHLDGNDFSRHLNDVITALSSIY